MAITVSSQSYDKIRRTWNIQITSELNTMPTIHVNRETIWALSSDNSQIIKQTRDSNVITLTATDPEFGMSINALASLLNINPAVDSLMHLASALADYADQQQQQQQ